MIIYNITTQVTWSIHSHWMQWLMESRLPALMATGIFSHHQLVRLLEVDDEEGPTYALQLYVKNDRSIEDYKTNHLPALSHNEKTLWGDQVLSFSSLMEVIN